MSASKILEKIIVASKAIGIEKIRKVLLDHIPEKDREVFKGKDLFDIFIAATASGSKQSLIKKLNEQYSDDFNSKLTESKYKEELTHVIFGVCAHFKMEPEYMIYGNDRNTERIMAFSFCIYYLDHIYKIDMKELSIFFGKTRTLFYINRDRITSLRPNGRSEYDKKYIGIKNELDLAFNVA